MSAVSTISNPLYHKVVQPLLDEHNGDASALLRAYPNFNPDEETADTFGSPYLHNACFYNHFYVIRGLLQCGAGLLSRDYTGCTPLAQACRVDGRKEVLVEWLLSEHADARATVNWTNDVGRTVLHGAALNGFCAMIHVLLKHGADITQKDFAGNTALHLATTRCGIAVARILLRHGANPTSKNNNGRTPTEQAHNLAEETPHHHRYFTYRHLMVKLLQTAERAQAILVIGEWRPNRHARFPHAYRAAMRTLVVLAKARTPAPEDVAELHSHYPRACLDLLPEELLQYLFAYISVPHVPDCWTLKKECCHSPSNTP